MIAPEVPVLIRIDQLERLYRSDVLRPELGQQYRRVINKALGSRDQRVSYRIGTRRYAWEDDLRIFGTADELEHLRDFRIIDIDDMLRRKEDTKTWIFPEFAADAFAKRIRYSGMGDSKGQGDLIRKVFGDTVSPEDAARKYACNSTFDRILKISDWPQVWKTYLESLFAISPLQAMLAAAWARQKGNESLANQRLLSPPPESKPWNAVYWRKERVRLCLMQIAARSVQRMTWAGKDHIIALSAGNISIFLSICHEIWEAFLRSERRKHLSDRQDPLSDDSPIAPEIQAVGIHTASADWYEKVAEQPNGHDRQRFLIEIARYFRTNMLADDAMSYPGENGFSLLCHRSLQIRPPVVTSK